MSGNLKQKLFGLVWDNSLPAAATCLDRQIVLMTRVFETFSRWGNQGNCVTFVQEVLTPGYTGVTNVLHDNLLLFTWP